MDKQNQYRQALDVALTAAGLAMTVMTDMDHEHLQIIVQLATWLWRFQKVLRWLLAKRRQRELDKQEADDMCDQ